MNTPSTPLQDQLVQPPYPALGEEPFNLSDDELWEFWNNPSRKMPEDEVSEHFERIFSKKFTLYPQVWLRDPNGNKYRIDYVGKESSESWDGLIGFELKHGSLCSGMYTDFSSALAQSIDSARSVVINDISGQKWYNHQLRYVFLFPCLYNVYESSTSDREEITVRDWQARGALKLAGKYGVGTIGRRKNWKLNPAHNDWIFTLAGHPAYWLETGKTLLGEKHAIGKRGGSGRG